MHESFSVCGDNTYMQSKVFVTFYQYAGNVGLRQKATVSSDGEHFRNKNETFAFEPDLKLKLQTLTL